MAHLLMINADSYRPGINEIGDVVNIRDDNHVYDPNELERFDELKITNVTQKELIDALRSYNPERAAYRMPTTLRNRWSLDEPEHKYVWYKASESKWYFREVKPKYRFSLKNISTEQKQLLEEIEQGTLATLSICRAAFLFKASEIPENQVECTDIN